MPIPAAKAVAYGGASLVDPLFSAPISTRHKTVIGNKSHKTSSLSFAYNPNKLSVRWSIHGRLRAKGAMAFKGMPGSLDSASCQGGGLHWLTPLPVRWGNGRASTRARARTDRSSGVSHKGTSEKPEWWWRSLAAAPYLIACQFSDAGYYVVPLLEHHETFEDLIFFIPGGAKRWHAWLPMIYCFAAYTLIVKNKKLPHFLRYHLIMAMLLETALQLVWVASNWAPLIHFNGSLGMYYWAAVGFLYIGVLLYGVQCALRGHYSDVPFFAEAALIHTEYRVGGFHRPF